MSGSRFVLVHTSDDDTLVPRPSYADVTERLVAEFGPAYGRTLVTEVVRCCRTGEAGLPTLVAPESLEALARGRLCRLPTPSPEDQG